MLSELNRLTLAIAALLLALISRAGATETAPPPCQVLISVRDQRLAVVEDGELVARYPVSTSKFGTGDQFWSYKTPVGELKVCEKIGGNLAPGTVIRHRAPTGEVLPVNAPGRDPIVTRLIWLDGLEAQNKNAKGRGIYIHGTPEERTIGTPVSWGCIRMRSRDVIKVFDQVPVGTVVSIIPARLPHMHKYEPPKVQPAPVIDTAIAAAKVSAEQAKPGATPGKPAEVVAQKIAAPMPPIAEGPDHGGGWSAWRALKGSFLMANLPGMDSDRVADNRKKTTQ